MFRLHYVLIGCLVPAVCCGELVLNELMVKPAGEEGEWVEVTNAGPQPIDLSGWWLADATGKARAISQSEILAPGAFVVLAARPESLRLAYDLPPEVLVLRPDGWPVLNDRDGSGGAPADVVVLGRPNGSTADSLVYFESWLPALPGGSLERADLSRSATDPGAWGWSLAPEGATPGAMNSLAAPGGSTSVTAVWDGPKVVDPTRSPAVFTFQLPGPGHMAVWLVDLHGAPGAVLQGPLAVGAVGRWVWGTGTPRAPRSGAWFLCLRWQGSKGAPLRRCRLVWVR